MPVYKYKCKACPAVKQVFFHFLKSPEEIDCEKCGEPMCKSYKQDKIIHTPNEVSTPKERVEKFIRSAQQDLKDQKTSSKTREYE